MKQARLWGAALCAGLLFASAARAAIVTNLETPSVTGAGKTILSGFAYHTGGKTVTVKARIDGVTLADPEVIVPSGTIRQDVTANVNSGFSLGFNFGTAFSPPGPHTIGVEISAPGEAIVIIDRAIEVIHLGNAAFVEDLDLSGASCSLQGNTINLNNVRVIPSEGQPFPVFAGAVSLSGLSYGLGYFFVAVACESRYHYWTAIAAGLSMVLLLVETTTKEILWPSVSK